MIPQKIVVFFGRSGAGKGTQAKLLIEYLKTHDSQRRVVYVETGERFRAFMDSGSRTAEKVKEVLRNGELLPAFLPIWIWTQFLVDETKHDEHMIFDGVARRREEAPILDSALHFYADGIVPYIVFLDTHPDAAKTRLIKRGRFDDTHEKIDARFKWFESDVVPSVRYFEEHTRCRFVKVNGDGTVEEVFEGVKRALDL